MRSENNKGMRADLVFAVCIGFSYLLPFRFYPYASFYNDALVIFGLGVAFLLLVKETRVISVHLPWIAALPFVLAIILFIQVGVLDISIHDVLLPIVYFLVAGLAVILGATLGSKREQRENACITFAWVFLIVGLISVALSVIQLLHIEAIFSPFVLPVKHGQNIAVRPFANLGQPNHLALLLCFSIASTWYLYESGRFKALSAIGITLCFIFGLVLSQSRIGWIVVPAFCCLALVIRRDKRTKNVSPYVLAAFLISYFFLIFELSTITSFLTGLPTQPLTDRVGAASQSARLVLFREALQISVEHPWFGAGWYQFGPEQVRIAADFPPAPYSRYAHNIVLSFAAELGWPLTLLIFGALTYWCYLNFRRIESKETAFALFFFTPILVHSMVEFPLWYAYVLLPAAFMIGVVSYQEKGNYTFSRLVPRPHMAILFVLLSACVIVLSNDYRRVVAGYNALNLELLGLRFKDSPTSRPNRTFFPQFYDYFEFAKAEAEKGESLNELRSREKTARQFGYAPVLMDMSLHYALNGQPDQAVRKMVTLQKLNYCGYTKYYDIWKKRALETEYSSIFMQLPLPDSAACY